MLLLNFKNYNYNLHNQNQLFACESIYFPVLSASRFYLSVQPHGSVLNKIQLHIETVGQINRFMTAAFLGLFKIRLQLRTVIRMSAVLNNYFCSLHRVKATDIGTMVTGKSLGDAVRSLKTPFSKQFAKMEADPQARADAIRAFGTGSLRKAVFDGDLAGGSFLAGEVAGLIRRRESAAAIVDDIIGGAEKLLKQAPGLINE